MNQRQVWNQRHATEEIGSSAPSAFLEEIAHLLPPPGAALDVAGGAGRNAIWLAQKGFQVILADFSSVALEKATGRAAAVGVELHPLEIDLENAPFPAGPWQAILSFNFLWRPLYPHFAAALAPGGLLIVSQPTVRNLERRSRPPRPYLFEEGELLSLAGELEVLHYTEGWHPGDHHEAHLAARKLGAEAAR
jgi:SAM-dependent methyltransferase